MTLEELDDRIANGQNLCVLDEYIIDVTSILSSHPGGRFVIEGNIGRDISKFFHGGYTMENIDYVEPYAHSNEARLMIKNMIVGRLQFE